MELTQLTATELAGLLRAKRIGVEELARAYVARIEKYGGSDDLNAVAEVNADIFAQARQLDTNDAAAHSRPLFGLPMLIKDNIDVAGLHTTAGSLALADNLPARDAPIIASLRQSGALILGKTNMTEFANYTGHNMPNGYSSRGGQVRNAYDRTQDPSGSSSGSAVAMSADLCAAAVGTDTSFSIVGCATVNGVTGLKPAHGSLSSSGILPISHTLDSAGPITRDMADALLVYSAMRASPLPPITPIEPRHMRLAVNNYNRADVSESQLALYAHVLDGLRRAGAYIAEVSHPHSPHQCDIMRCEFRHDLEEYLAQSNAHLRSLGDIVSYYNFNSAHMLKHGVQCLTDALHTASGKLDDADYIAALAARRQVRAELLASLGSFDACLMSGPTNVMHFAGLPSLALRLGMGVDGMPRGMILYGAAEPRLFAAALTIEKYCQPVTPPQL